MTSHFGARLSINAALALCVGTGVAASPPKQAQTLPVTQAWLVGTWDTPDRAHNTLSSCESDGPISFNRDGTYYVGENAGHGNYRTDGSRITYYHRVLVDEDQNVDRSKYNTPLVTRVVRLSPTTMREDGNLYARCKR